MMLDPEFLKIESRDAIRARCKCDQFGNLHKSQDNWLPLLERRLSCRRRHPSPAVIATTTMATATATTTSIDNLSLVNTVAVSLAN